MTTVRDGSPGHPGPAWRLYPVFAGLFATILVLIPAASTKIFALGPFNLPGGTLVFPIAFILNDVLTEVYGYDGSRRIIWTGLGCQVLAALTYFLVGVLPPSRAWPNQVAYQAVLGQAPRVALASLAAYLCGEFANSFVLSRMKFRQAGRTGASQRWRFLASTIVGEGVDSCLFMTLAYAGTLPVGTLGGAIATLYVAKVLYEALALPVSVRVANWVKRVEGVDRIDAPAETDYNPFALFYRAQRSPGVRGAR